MNGVQILARPLGIAANWLLDLALPPRCPGCSCIVVRDRTFCADCWAQLKFLTAPQCACCGLPFDHDIGPDARCGECLLHPPRYDSARAAFIYDGPARTLLLAFKNRDREHLAKTMAPALARAGVALLGDDALLVPVPLHYWRMWRRGYNQAVMLARALARLRGIELAVDALQRVKATPTSRGMGRKARAANVRGVFRVADAAQVRGRRIILIDDVLTTGATAEACARVLKRAGAREVHVLTWARVVRQGGLVT